MYKSLKTGKEKHKVNAWAVISRNGRSDIELFTNNMDSDFYWEVLKRNIKSLKKWEEQILFYNETLLHLMLAQKLYNFMRRTRLRELNGQLNHQI